MGFEDHCQGLSRTTRTRPPNPGPGTVWDAAGPRLHGRQTSAIQESPRRRVRAPAAAGHPAAGPFALKATDQTRIFRAKGRWGSLRGSCNFPLHLKFFHNEELQIKSCRKHGAHGKKADTRGHRVWVPFRRNIQNRQVRGDGQQTGGARSWGASGEKERGFGGRQ